MQTLSNKDNSHAIPKKIWFLWLQGYDEAPKLVQRCFESWQYHNPDWELTFLTEDNMADYIDLGLPAEKMAKLTRPLISDLVRLKLLAEHGGVWVDSTCICKQPLDHWLGQYLDSGFFVFHQHDKERILTSWFMASEPGNALTSKMYHGFSDYFLNNSFSNYGRFKRPLRKLTEKILNKSPRTTRYWFSPFVSKVLRISPYFAIHYLFEKLVFEDSVCKAIWESTNDFPAVAPQKIRRVGPLTPITPELKQDFDQGIDPLYKLKYKWSEHIEKGEVDTVIGYLLNKDITANR
ncbi:capsular polysaccharide synthesis protein [Oceanicoccus sagamiensis]|uniref:Capsular biosynthesis protein n=1 Tax=Oceanicoccus sagamiensis TaxID=716816 RepID=A0A1X9NAA9_9GAMM|nr:capsular polysaccharide synthesis protein [Oceanicoccus sagamiensis]ARN72875.1 hypothetical protein BST96_01395 [Oceanicoccus sagamiensis]